MTKNTAHRASRLRQVPASLAVATLALSGTALAQPNKPARVIEEVVVTAQKSQQSLQDVPISISALSGDFMQENAIGDLVEVSTYVPNVRVEFTSPSSPQVFIRGFGTNSFNPSFEPAVGLVQDEVFFGRPSYFSESMYDLDRVEVLRGPHGTLFAKTPLPGSSTSPAAAHRPTSAVKADWPINTKNTANNGLKRHSATASRPASACASPCWTGSAMGDWKTPFWTVKKTTAISRPGV